MKYTLMHRNIEVVDVEIDEENGGMGKIFKPASPEHMPVGTMTEKTGIDVAALRRWWQGRSIPATRSRLHDFLESLDIPSTGALLTKSMGLSLSDQYWIRPSGSRIEWSEVNFFDNGFSDDVGDLLFGMDVNG